MPPDASGRNRTSTGRTSIRHSLNFASVGKAFADVINKDNRELDKNAKKALKDSKRSGAINLKSAAPRSSIGGDSKSTAPRASLTLSSDSRTATRKRNSGAFQPSSTEDGAVKPADANTSMSKPATLRPRPATTSALPKYRPRSVTVDGEKKPPSPVRAGVRRRLSTSDEDTEGTKSSDKSLSVDTVSEKAARPISPLPHRTALKAVVNSSPVTPSTPSRSKSKVAAPSGPKPSPTRPTKHAKTTSLSSSIPRPPSASSSVAPSTPKSSSAKNGHGRSQSVKESPTSSRNIFFGDSPKHLKKGSKSSKPVQHTPRVNAGNMSNISEGGSDEEFEDVARLLAPVAVAGAPTPAMPRIEMMRSRRRLVPETPSRPEPSFIASLPADDDSPSSLRLRPSPASDHAAPRGSILSWDQVADEASRTLGEDEIKTMLSEVDAPFRSGASSPIFGPLFLPVPESPCLSALSTPGGYGSSSISQVMLPDVTPSPAMHHFRQSGGNTPKSPGDSATVTLLRLQLASVENTAKERLRQLQAMEEEIHLLKEARRDDAVELSKQVEVLEEQMRGNLEARERTAEEQNMFIMSLQSELEQMKDMRDRAEAAALERARLEAKALQDTALRIQQVNVEGACLARSAARDWASVAALATSELASVKSDSEVLAVLLSQLDLLEAQLGVGTMD